MFSLTIGRKFFLTDKDETYNYSSIVYFYILYLGTKEWNVFKYKECLKSVTVLMCVSWISKYMYLGLYSGLFYPLVTTILVHTKLGNNIVIMKQIGNFL